MAEQRYLLQPGHPDHGTVCPLCAAPKCRQSMRCAQCYTDARRRHEYPAPPVPQRKAKAKTAAEGSKSNPQPQSHPWRGRAA